MNLTRIYNLMDELLAIDSPSGMTADVTAHVVAFLERLNLPVFHTNKGAVFTVMGENTGADAHARLVVAHVDTLGAVISDIAQDGTISMFRIGGCNMASVEGTNVRVCTRHNGVLPAMVMPKKMSVHVFSAEAHEMLRTEDNMTLRIMCDVSCRQDVIDYGIHVGDVICFEARAQYMNGFVTSRFLDDKLCVAIMMAEMEELCAAREPLSRRTYFFFSDYEEAGHGLYGVPVDVSEVIALDIGCVGGGHPSSEHKVSIVAKDKFTIYDYDLRRKLESLAEKNGVDFVVEAYKYFGSDASVAITQGCDFRFACMGPGVSGSHHVERTHNDSVRGCAALLHAYLRAE